MTFGKGLKPSTPSKIAHRLRADRHSKILAALAVGPRGSASLTPCQRMDQGQTGTCHAHSFAGALWTAYNSAGKTMPFVASPRLIAGCTYSDVRAASAVPGQLLPPLTDDGAELQDDATAAQRWGVAPIQAPTSDGRYSDVENDPPDNTFPEPDTSQLQLAGQDLISGEYAISVDSNAPLMLCASLDAGIPIWEGGPVNANWENLGPNDVADANCATGGEGHAQYITDYRTVSPGVYEYLYQGTWGNGWALNGSVWVKMSFIMTRWALWPMTVVEP